jgi:hypothetical protein
MTILILKKMSDAIRGIYPAAKTNGLPDRFRYLEPEAAASLELLQHDFPNLAFSDIFRSPSESLVALRSKAGVQPPGYSGHNFGFSVDVAVDEATRGCSYSELLDRMASSGWHCHRRDRARGPEDWHFNYFGFATAADRYLVLAHEADPVTWARPIEALIEDRYGPSFRLSISEAQKALAMLRLYIGEIDGVFGPHTREAVIQFQLAWSLPLGPLDARTIRVLDLVTAERKIVP